MPSFSISDRWHSRNCSSGEGQKNSTADKGDEKEFSVVCLTALPNYVHFPAMWLHMRNKAQKGGSTAPTPCHVWPALLLWLQYSNSFSTCVHQHCNLHISPLSVFHS